MYINPDNQDRLIYMSMIIPLVLEYSMIIFILYVPNLFDEQKIPP